MKIFLIFDMIKCFIKAITRKIFLFVKKSWIFKKLFITYDFHIEPFYGLEETNKLLGEIVNDSHPHFVGRLGESEVGGILWQARKERIPFIKYPQVYLDKLSINSGMFSTSFFGRHYFKKEYTKAAKMMDYVGVFGEKWFPGEGTFLKKYSKIDRSHYLHGSGFDAFFSYQINIPWTSFLNGKKVLVINPNIELIEKQYEKREKLFPKDKNVLPSFSLCTYKPFITNGLSDKKKYGSWKKCLNIMKNDIDKIDFDIALVSCGSYGMPLCSHIYKNKKTAIYVGGCLQLFFGILGKRWENVNLYTGKYIRDIVNNHWARPDKNTIPEGFENIEGGCYW